MVVTDKVSNGKDIDADAIRLVYREPIQGDLNFDGKVDNLDYELFRQNFGNKTCGNIADLDQDCQVTIFDYNFLVGNFGKSSQ